MELHGKNIWKKILRAHSMSLVIISILFILFIARSGSLTASLTVGIVLFLAVFAYSYSEYRHYTRKVIERDGQEPAQRVPEYPG